MPKTPTPEEIEDLRKILTPAFAAAVPIVADFMQAVEAYRENGHPEVISGFVNGAVDKLIKLSLLANEEGWLDR